MCEVYYVTTRLDAFEWHSLVNYYYSLFCIEENWMHKINYFKQTSVPFIVQDIFQINIKHVTIPTTRHLDSKNSMVDLTNDHYWLYSTICRNNNYTSKWRPIFSHKILAFIYAYVHYYLHYTIKLNVHAVGSTETMMTLRLMHIDCCVNLCLKLILTHGDRLEGEGHS